MKKTKICFFSDTHRQHEDVKIPDCDILVFCGDFDIRSLEDLEYANKWFGKQKAKDKIFVAGNHDTWIEKLGKEKVKKLFTNATYLEDESVIIKGLKFYGSPWSPEFNNWSFMKPRGSKDLYNIWKNIPNKTDILVTHCPPYSFLDKNFKGEMCGCEVLLRELCIKRPKYHAFGHIHLSGSQKYEYEGINFLNCSVLDEDYKLKNSPILIEI